MPDKAILAVNLASIISSHRKRLAEKRIDPDKLISPKRWQALNATPAISGSYVAISESDAESGTKAPPLKWTIRVDVDGWYPQNWISIEIESIFGFIASAIFKLDQMSTPSESSVRLEASRIHAFGNVELATFDGLIFEAARGTSGLFESFVLTLEQNGYFDRTFMLKYEGAHFSKLDIEIDNLLVAPASEFRAPVTTSLNTKEHGGNLPTLTKEVLTLPKVFGRAGFATKVKINATPQFTDLAGDDKLWNDSELHNAMVGYWSHYADLPQWSLWSIFADTHEDGRLLMGVMFDHVGDFQRQGSAVFLDSQITTLPLDDFLKHIDPTPTVKRRVFFTMIHEMGHALNLGHSFDKVEGTPWLPQINDSEARSFMNYPDNVTGGVKEFFAKFGWRFGDDELKFLRHAPRGFVKPGGVDWHENHGAFMPQTQAFDGLNLTIACDHLRHNLEFMEPLWLDVRLANNSANSVRIDRNAIDPAGGLTLLVRRNGGVVRQFSPMMHRCFMPELNDMPPGQMINGRHFISADAHQWLIDEPGLYEVQGLADINGRVYTSNLLKVFVSSPTSRAQDALAASYFATDVSRIIAFDGAPSLDRANATLDDLIETMPQSAAAQAAVIARHAPELGRYKTLSFSPAGQRVTVISAPLSDVTRTRLKRSLAGHPDLERMALRLRSGRMANQLRRLLSGR